MPSSRQIQVGDCVRFLHDQGGGVVISVRGAGSKTVLTVENAEGFPMEYEACKCLLAPNSRQEHIAYGSTDIAGAIAAEKAADARSGPGSSSLRQRQDAHAIDLHIETLTENLQRLSDHDKFELQLETFNQEMDRAVKHRLRRLVFIHGVGSGRLREAILDEIEQHWPQCVCESADPYTYGNGATQVYFKQD
ncbi:MAG: hypothetical protein P8M07_00335 [Flavobacteriales bacterium]|nr:hypothetical protein [Flavobacteriales bacterium]